MAIYPFGYLAHAWGFHFLSSLGRVIVMTVKSGLVDEGMCSYCGGIMGTDSKVDLAIVTISARVRLS